MLTRCLFCHKRFPARSPLEWFPPAERLAYDPARGRIWLICGHCRRWSLVPLEDRGTLIEALERIARDRARLVARTPNISLLHTDDALLVRVGRAELEERSWWRYGGPLLRRRTAFERRPSRISALTYGAMARLGESMGLVEHGPITTWTDTAATDVLRWWHFGWAAWYGRARCPSCNSVLRALPFDLTWWAYPTVDQRGEVGLGVPCQRCDPWTPDKVYPIRGAHAVHVLRRALAYQNIAGASERMIRDAAAAIDQAGSLADYTRRTAVERVSLWKMGRTRAIALEIALNEGIEQRALDGEARTLEAAWREQEELAAIVDDELSWPPSLSRS